MRVVLEHYDRVAFASTCTTFRDAIWEVVKGEREEGKERKHLVTNLRKRKLVEKASCFILDWFEWVHGPFDRREGDPPTFRDKGFQYPRKDLYDSDLMKVAAFQGSIETMEWLRSKGIPLDIGEWDAAKAAAHGGQIKVLEWLISEGFKFDLGTSDSAASGGQLATLKWYVLAFSLFFSFLFPFADSSCSFSSAG